TLLRHRGLAGAQQLFKQITGVHGIALFGQLFRLPTIVFATACANCFRLGPDSSSPNARVIRPCPQVAPDDRYEN
ncbi:hypothetical protein, partial [Pseudomonas sp. GW460-12-10-14-TSB1]|uniref:hypothetical protein n=1 Tax=Pseudomonas sp. GW460-12-10-14-TSB1 TaxID=2751364 RepID=UPI001A922A8A